MKQVTEKQKAQELVSLFRSKIYEGVITNADVNPQREKARDEKAKSVAILHCDQLLNEIDERFQGFLDWDVKAYYERVKKQIELL